MKYPTKRMEYSTKYALLGCASLAMAAGGCYGARQIGNELAEKRNVTAQELREIENKKQDLATKLQSCPTVDDCRAVFSRYQATDKHYKAITDQYIKLEKAGPFDGNEGLVFWMMAFLGVGLASVYIPGTIKMKKLELNFLEETERLKSQGEQ